MKYFKLSEFETNGYKVTNETIKRNITALVDNVLDKVRAYYGKAIYVTEGYNPQSNHDDHITGCAAEITTKTKAGNISIYNYIKTLDYNELIVNGDYDTIHVSYNAKNQKKAIDTTTKYMSSYIVGLDSGHGKNVAGKRSPDGKVIEWEWAKDIKQRVMKEMESQKIAKCYDANPEDTEPGLTVRATRMNDVYKKNGNKGIFISIHINASGMGQWMTARGWSIWTSVGKTESDNLAEYIWQEANKIFPTKGQKMRADKSDGDNDYESNFTVLVKTACPAVLIENFFMDNKEDCAYLMSEQGKKDCTTVIVNGIKKYLATKK